MSYAELLVLAITLCFDTFSASVSGGLMLDKSLTSRQYAKIILTFGFFQSGFMLLGWAMGIGLYEYLMLYDHWVAFLLLNFLGIKMIYDSCSSKTDHSEFLNLLDQKNVVLLSVATSIDAMAVGLTQSLLNLGVYKMIFSVLSVLVLTSLTSYIGIRIAKIFSVKFGKYSAIVGGAILISVGFKILIEHLPHSGINF